MPFIITCPSLQYQIRKDILLDDHYVQLVTKLNCTNSIDDIFDRSVIAQNGWFLYGSSKPNRIPYKLSTIYLYNENKLTKIKNEYTNKELIKILSIRNKQVNVLYDNFRITVKKMINSKETDRKDIKKLINLLSSDRAEDYNKWISIGWCLHNIGKDLLDIWIDFSKKSSKSL